MLNALVMADQEKAARDLAREVLTRHLAALGPEDIAFLDPAREFDALPPEAGLEPSAPDVSTDASPDASPLELPVELPAEPPAGLPAAEDGIYFSADPPDNGRTDQPDG